MAKKYGIGLLTVALCLLTVASSQAVQLYWNPPVGSDGNWDTTNTTWGTTSAATDTVWTGSPDDALFQVAGGTVTVQANGVSVHNMNFDVDEYVLTASTITLAGTSPTITVTNAGETAEIDSVLAGVDGMTKAGAGATGPHGRQPVQRRNHNHRRPLVPVRRQQPPEHCRGDHHHRRFVEFRRQ